MSVQKNLSLTLVSIGKNDDKRSDLCSGRVTGVNLEGLQVGSDPPGTTDGN